MKSEETDVLYQVIKCMDEGLEVLFYKDPVHKTLFRIRIADRRGVKVKYVERCIDSDVTASRMGSSTVFAREIEHARLTILDFKEKL